MKAKYLLFFIVLMFIPKIVFASDMLSEEYQLSLYNAKVIEVVDVKNYKDTTVQTLKIKILNKDLKDHESIIKNTLSFNGSDIKLKKGDKISVHMEKDDGEYKFYFEGYDKTGSLIVLSIIFIICTIAFGGIKGIKSLIALVFTILLILFGLVPLLLKGHNPIILSIITCVISTILTFSITNGFTKKSLIAILGVTAGLIISGLIAYIFALTTRITGFASGDAQMLQYLPSGIVFDFKGLLFASIIIGALGACMDVSMEITSSLSEIKKHHPKISNVELIKSGFNIGKDMMGTMINTLILAYSGTSLSTILIFIGFNKGFSDIINLDSITTEIIRSLSGSIGLLFAIPATIFLFIFFNKGGHYEK